ncbi:hypothetical protein PybrP1_008257 [[Pythium] brassicae (nom. inval.)]|nr:hypothetical protein PybrP1_008257 [[Pythium] brassicae (nom. inval.)]
MDAVASSGAGVWAFYYIQGEDGEDRSHPNAFRVPLPNAAADITLADVRRHFPLPAAAFHFRFRVNAKAASGANFFWLDVTAPTLKVPLVNGRVICKLLRLERPPPRGLVFRRKPVLQWTDAAKAPVQPFHRAASSPAFENDRPAKYSDSASGGSRLAAAVTPPQSSHSHSPAAKSRSASGGSSRSGSGSQAKVEPTVAPDSFEDFLSGGGQAAAAAQAAQHKAPVNLMADSGWSDAPSAPQKPVSAASSFLNAMDPLAQAPSAGASGRPAPASSSAAEPPKFDDDPRQTVGPVTMAEMQKHATSTADGTNVYNAKFVDKSTKSPEVRRAMEERERQTQADVEKAREELRQRDDAARAMTAMKERAALVLGPKLKSWAEDNGRVKNIRTLLSTMHQVMWDESKWAEVNMGKLINPTDVKKHYRKAMIVVHPDKSGGRNAEQLLIAERVFAAVNTAWDDFAKTNPC